MSIINITFLSGSPIIPLLFQGQNRGKFSLSFSESPDFTSISCEYKNIAVADEKYFNHKILLF